MGKYALARTNSRINYLKTRNLELAKYEILRPGTNTLQTSECMNCPSTRNLDFTSTKNTRTTYVYVHELSSTTRT